MNLISSKALYAYRKLQKRTPLERLRRFFRSNRGFSQPMHILKQVTNLDKDATRGLLVKLVVEGLIVPSEAINGTFWLCPDADYLFNAHPYRIGYSWGRQHV